MAIFVFINLSWVASHSPTRGANSLLLTSSCVGSADGYRHVIFGRRFNPIGLWSRREYGPSMLQGFYTKRNTGASFSKSTGIQKSLGGLKLLTRDQMHIGSGSSGNVAEHGLWSKLPRSFRANGSALCVFFCALEALTVINPLVEIVHSHAWE